MEELLEKREELNTIAGRTSNRREQEEKYYDQGKEASNLTVGDQALLKREQRKSGLKPKLDGQFTVPEDGAPYGASKEVPATMRALEPL